MVYVTSENTYSNFSDAIEAATFGVAQVLLDVCTLAVNVDNAIVETDNESYSKANHSISGIKMNSFTVLSYEYKLKEDNVYAFIVVINKENSKMKKINVMFFLLLTIVLICSCATGIDINKKNVDDSPTWTTEIPKSSKYLYGVGRAKLLIDFNSQSAADAAARADLALKTSIHMKEALAMYSNEASANVVSAYETLILQSVNVLMKSVVSEQRWSAEDGTVWSLVSFKVKDLPSLYKDSANDYLNQLEEKKISTQKKLIELLKQLEESNEDDVAELKELAQEKADSIVSEVVEIENSFDVSSQVEEITKYLIEKGYELDN